MLSIFPCTIMSVCLLWKDVYLGLLPPFLKFVFNYSGFTMALPLFKILILLYCICYVSYHIFGRGLPGRSPDGWEELGDELGSCLLAQVEQTGGSTGIEG